MVSGGYPIVTRPGYMGYRYGELATEVRWFGPIPRVIDTLWVWVGYSERTGPTRYGFGSAQARNLAAQLADLDGFGPVSAAKMASLVGPEGLERAAKTGDLKALSRQCPGLGTAKFKTALEWLKGASAMPSGPVGDALAVLAGLGVDITPQVVEGVRRYSGTAEQIVSLYLEGTR